MLPRFKDLTDCQILDTAFKLGDAQELVAWQAVFETWQALKTGVRTMTGSVPTVFQPVLSAVEAQLFVGDIGASRAFFVSKLGSTVAFTCGEPPFYGRVKRDGAAFNLRLVCEPVFAGDLREREQLPSASMTVDSAAEIKRLFLQYQDSEVDLFQPLNQAPWGARTFFVRNPDGNLLLFAGPAA